MRRDLIEDVTVYLVSDAAPRVGPIEHFLARVIDAGVGMVQLRQRGQSDRDLVATARIFATVCRENGALFIVNDRLDLAMLVGADGVHVGQNDIHPNDVRRVAGKDFIIGQSTHSTSEIDAANSSEVDYIGVGPIYETPTKEGRPAVGLDLVRYAASNAQKPFFAIGGIDASKAVLVREAGAKSVSVLRARENRSGRRPASPRSIPRSRFSGAARGFAAAVRSEDMAFKNIRPR
jgi:thiamine-phosphate pyrophosphorylase